jgi:hypothetical protein
MAKAIPSTSANQEVIQFKKGNTEESAITVIPPKKRSLLKRRGLLLFND